MSDEDGRSTLDGVTGAALEVLATTWPEAETDDEMGSVVNGVDLEVSGGDC